MSRKMRRNVCTDDALPLLDGERRPRDSIHTALLEDKTPEILFDEDALGDTELVSKEGAIGLDQDTQLLLFKSTGRVSAKEKWGHEPLALDMVMQSVGIDLLDGFLVKVEGLYLPDEQHERSKEREYFELEDDELILKVHLFRVHREIHAIQFVTNERTSERFGNLKRGELCKAVEAPEGKYIAGFFGDLARGDEEIDLGFRFADRPEGKEDRVEDTEVDVAEIDHVN